MADITITILLAITTILIAVAMILNSKLIKMFQKQRNEDLFSIKEANYQLDNAEKRIVTYARTIKKVEDIIIESKNNNEFAVETIKKIEKVLFPDNKQVK